MPDTTFEEASRCPKCEAAGTLINQRAGRPVQGIGIGPQVQRRGVTVHLFECRNDRCPDFMPPTIVGLGTMQPAVRGRWWVQTNPDGTVPPKGTGNTGEKAYSLPGANTQMAQRARDELAYLDLLSVKGPDDPEVLDMARQIYGRRG